MTHCPSVSHHFKLAIHRCFLLTSQGTLVRKTLSGVRNSSPKLVHNYRQVSVFVSPVRELSVPSDCWSPKYLFERLNTANCDVCRLRCSIWKTLISQTKVQSIYLWSLDMKCQWRLTSCIAWLEWHFFLEYSYGILIILLLLLQWLYISCSLCKPTIHAAF